MFKLSSMPLSKLSIWEGIIMFLTKIELEKAVEIVLSSVKEIQDIEKIPLREATGRILAKDYYAPMNNPPFDRSPLDGYAIRAEDSKGASKENPVYLEEIDKVYAGEVSNEKLDKFQCIRIMTGGKMPEGSNSVIRLEDIEKEGNKIAITQELKPYDNYVFAGEDIKKGDLLMKSHSKLTFAHLGVLGSMGEKYVEVKRKPKVGILSTGDELISYGQPLEDGKIYDTNGTMLASRLEEMGLVCQILESSKDEVEEVSNLILENIDEFDLIITTGGVSVGDKDIFHSVIDNIGGTKKFWRVNIRPGTPMMFSILGDKPILSLSGNPFAALTNFELVGRPLLYKLSGDESINIRKVKGVLKDSYPKNSMKTRRIIRCKYEEGSIYLPDEGHSSGKMLKMIGCNGLIDMKKGREPLKSGDKVEVFLI